MIHLHKYIGELIRLIGDRKGLGPINYKCIQIQDSIQGLLEQYNEDSDVGQQLIFIRGSVGRLRNFISGGSANFSYEQSEGLLNNGIPPIFNWWNE
jgi:hypothetical protein